jgi:hypothetical protein
MAILGSSLESPPEPELPLPEPSRALELSLLQPVKAQKPINTMRRVRDPGFLIGKSSQIALELYAVAIAFSAAMPRCLAIMNCLIKRVYDLRPLREGFAFKPAAPQPGTAIGL